MAVQRRVAVGVDDQAVGQAVGVLVVAAPSASNAAAGRARTGRRRSSGCPGGATGTSAWSAGCRPEACSCWRCRCGWRRACRCRCSHRRARFCRTGSPPAVVKLPACGVKPIGRPSAGSRGRCWPGRTRWSRRPRGSSSTSSAVSASHVQTKWRCRTSRSRSRCRDCRRRPVGREGASGCREGFSFRWRPSWCRAPGSSRRG